MVDQAKSLKQRSVVLPPFHMYLCLAMVDDMSGRVDEPSADRGPYVCKTADESSADGGRAVRIILNLLIKV